MKYLLSFEEKSRKVVMIEQPVTNGSTLATTRRGRPVKAVMQEDRANKSPTKTNESLIKII